MRLMSIYNYPKEMRLAKLYKLLKERTPAQSISHKKMPSRKEHEAFIERKPYAIHYFICPSEDLDKIWGAVYLTCSREIGVQVFEKHKGYGVGTKAIEELMEIHKGPYLANIAPSNLESSRFFKKLGFHMIQHTYKKE